jgi:hypothetical protein
MDVWAFYHIQVLSNKNDHLYRTRCHGFAGIERVEGLGATFSAEKGQVVRGGRSFLCRLSGPYFYRRNNSLYILGLIKATTEQKGASDGN